MSDPGDTTYIKHDLADRTTIMRANEVLEEGQKPAKYKPVVQGIRLASL